MNRKKLSGMTAGAMKGVLAIVLMTTGGAAAAADDEAVGRGREAYMAYGCAACHGKHGEGDGLSGRGMYPPPTNFHRVETFNRGHDKDSIRHSIAFGVKEGDSIMPAFTNIPANELSDLTAYVVSLQGSGSGTLKVAAARIQPMPPAVTSAAAYLVLENPTGKDVVLVGALTDASPVTEIHQMIRKDGMMRMAMIKELVVPAGGKVDFEQEGYHLMLIDVKKNFQKGEAVRITLRFSDGSTLETEARVHDE